MEGELCASETDLCVRNGSVRQKRKSLPQKNTFFSLYRADGDLQAGDFRVK